MNKYEGPNSAYAKHEKAFVPYIPSRGVNLLTGASIAALIIRDYLRGYGYDSKGRRIPFTEDLFRKRLFYLIALCHKHTRSPGVCRKLEEIVRYAYKHKRLPPGTVVLLAGENADKLASELIHKKIASLVRVVTPRKVLAPRRARKPVPIPVPVIRRRR